MLTNVGPDLMATVADTKANANLRVAALKALNLFHDIRLPEAVKLAVADGDENVRKEGNRLQASMQPSNAVGVVADVMSKGTIVEKQDALGMVSVMQGEAADKLIADWMDKLIAGNVPKEIQFELLQAARSHRVSDLVKDKLARYEAAQPKDDEFAGFRETSAWRRRRSGPEDFHGTAGRFLRPLPQGEGRRW